MTSSIVNNTGRLLSLASNLAPCFGNNDKTATACSAGMTRLTAGKDGLSTKNLTVPSPYATMRGPPSKPIAPGCIGLRGGLGSTSPLNTGMSNHPNFTSMKSQDVPAHCVGNDVREMNEQGETAEADFPMDG